MFNIGHTFKKQSGVTDRMKKDFFFTFTHENIIFFEEIGTIQKQLSSSPFFFFIIWSTLDIFPKNPCDILK